MIDEIRENAHIKEFAAKQIAARRYNSKVISREMKEGEFVLKQVVTPTRIGKLMPNWDGPYKIKEKLSHGAYRLGMHSTCVTTSIELHCLFFIII